MSLIADLKILSQLALARGEGNTQQERLENFYGNQAEGYDDFRKKLLFGRQNLISNLTFPRHAHVVDIGGGTGANLEALNLVQRANIKNWALVDLCPSLLEVANQKIKSQNLHFAETFLADACSWQPSAPVDTVLFSYSATMIPDWLTAFENAYQMLKPGGQIAVVDFYVARKFPTNTKRHSTFTRHFWPLWFSWDNVFLNQDHLPWLQHRFNTVDLQELSAPLPYLPFSRVPYYLFIGEKAL